MAPSRSGTVFAGSWSISYNGSTAKIKRSSQNGNVANSQTTRIKSKEIVRFLKHQERKPQFSSNQISNIIDGLFDNSVISPHYKKLIRELGYDV